MAERAPRLIEQIAHRRRVQVDVVTVGQHELHETQRILGAGALPDAQLPGIQRRQAFGAQGHTLRIVARSADDLEIATAEKARSAAELGQELAAHDAIGHVPVRPEDDVLQVGCENGRAHARERSADDHIHLQHP